MPRRNKTLKHQPFADKDSCATKRRFVSEKQAKEMATLLELQHYQPLSVYKCERCTKWHLTRKNAME